MRICFPARRFALATTIGLTLTALAQPSSAQTSSGRFFSVPPSDVNSVVDATNSLRGLSALLGQLTALGSVGSFASSPFTGSGVSGAPITIGGGRASGSAAHTGAGRNGATRPLFFNRAVPVITSSAAPPAMLSGAYTDTENSAITETGNTNLNGFALTYKGSGAITAQGILSGTGTGSTVTYSGAGTLTLTGANTYTGGTTISAGTVNVGVSSGMGTTASLGTGNVMVGSSGTLDFYAASSAGTSAATTLTNNNGLYFYDTSSAGNSTITNNNSVYFYDTSSANSSAITNNNSVYFNSTSSAGTSAITNNNGGYLYFADTSSAGSSTITNNNGGRLYFYDTSSASSSAITNNNGGYIYFQYTSSAGSSTITNNNGGSLYFYDTSTANNATLVNNAGASGFVDISFRTAGAGLSIGSVSGSGAVYLGSNALTVGGLASNPSTTISGVIRDGGINGGTGGSLIKAGTGILTLTGANTYTGGTTVSAGTLQLGDGTTNGTVTGDITDNASLIFDYGTSTSPTYSGVLSGNGILTKTGTGTLTLTGIGSSVGGGAQFNNGTTLITGATGITYASLMTGSTNSSDNIFSYIGHNVGDNGTVMVEGTSSSGVASSWNPGASNFFVGDSGTGTLNITGGGSVSSSYSEIGYASNGTVTVSGTNGSGVASSWNTQQHALLVGVFGTGTLNITGGGSLSSGLGYIGYDSGRGTVTVSGTSSDGVASQWNLTGGPPLYVGYYGTGTLNVTGGGNVGSRTSYIGYQSGSSGTVTVSGASSGGGVASQWNLGGAPLYVGYQGSSVLGITNGGAVTNGAGITFLSNQSGSSSSLIVNGGSLTTNALSIGSGTTPTIRLTNPTAANGGGYALNLGGSNGSSTIGFAIADAANGDGGAAGLGGAGGIDKTGTGTLTLNAANTFSGGMQIDGGSVVLGTALALQNSTAIINVDNGLNLNALSSATLGGLSGSGALALGTTALTDGGNNASTTYGGVSSGAGSLTKTGTGTLTLTGANTYTGGTTISAGKVVGSGGSISGTTLTSGALGTGMATIAAGATLSVGQAVNSSLTNRPSYGSLAIAGLNLSGGSTIPLLTFDIGPTGSTNGSTNDLLKFSGSANSLVFSGSGTYDIGFASESGSKITGSPFYTLMTFATPLAQANLTVANPSSKFSAVGTGNLGTINGGTFSWIVNGGNVTGLQFGLTSADTTPEPSALLLLAPGALAILAARKRRGA